MPPEELPAFEYLRSLFLPQACEVPAFLVWTIVGLKHALALEPRVQFLQIRLFVERQFEEKRSLGV